MALELKKRHRRLESSGSSVSIFTFGPRSEEDAESYCSDKDIKPIDAQLTESLITLHVRPSLDSIPVIRTSTMTHSYSPYLKRPDIISCSKFCRVQDPYTTKKCGCFIF